MTAANAGGGVSSGPKTVEWSPAALGRFRIKDCGDDGAVIYDIISGDTHLVDPLAMELLQMLREHSPRTTAALVAGVVELFDGESEVSITDAVDESLAQLRRLELVAGSDA